MPQQDKQAEIAFSARQIGERGHYEHLNPQRRQKELELLGIAGMQNRLILDADCETGPYGLELARNGNRVIGIDISGDLLKVAGDWAARDSLPFFSLLGDIERMPFEDESIDVCFCGFIMHHLPESRHAVAEFYRVLKPGGILALIEPNGSNPVLRLSNTFRRTFLLGTCDEMGCCSANETNYPHQHYLKALSEGGFQQITCTSHQVLRVAPRTEKRREETLARKFLQFLLESRELAFFATARLLPQPYKWPALYLTARKPTGSDV